MPHRIIVLGAGYAGAMTAGRLARRLHREEVAITVVNAEPDFVERIRLHQLATGQDLKPRPLRDMFAGTGVELKIAKVTGLDADRKTVTASTRTAPRNSPTTRLSTPSAAAEQRRHPGCHRTRHEASRPGRCGCANARSPDAGQTVPVVGAA